MLMDVRGKTSHQRRSPTERACLPNEAEIHTVHSGRQVRRADLRQADDWLSYDATNLTFRPSTR